MWSKFKGFLYVVAFVVITFAFTVTNFNSTSAQSCQGTWESFPATVGQTWSPSGEYRVVNFWSNYPGVNQSLRKLLLVPGQNAVLLGGGDSTSFPASCQTEAQASFDANSNQATSIDQLRAEGLAYQDSGCSANGSAHTATPGVTWAHAAGWRVVNLWSNEPFANQAMRKLFLADGEQVTLFGGGDMSTFAGYCQAEARVAYYQNSNPEVSIQALRAEGLALNTYTCGSSWENHAPAVNQAWTPSGLWRVVNFWSNQPGANQTLRKLLIAPWQNSPLLGGGESFSWANECGGEARLNYYQNPNPVVTLQTLQAENLVMDGTYVSPACPSGTGPGGITAGSYSPQSLTQEQRQWLWNLFGNNPNETAPAGYGGQGCSGQQPMVPPCPSGVGAPGSFEPSSLSQQQRNELYVAFGHSGEAPIGYGGESCYGGTMTLPSFTGGTGNSGGTAPTDPTDPNNGTGGSSGSSTTVYTGLTSLQGQPAGQYVQVTVSGLRLRSEPNSSGTIVGHLTNGHYYRLLEISGDWGQIEPVDWQGPAAFGWTYLVGNAISVAVTQPVSPEPSQGFQRCSVPIRAINVPERGGQVLEIPLVPLPSEFDIYFEGHLVLDSLWGVQHNSFAGEPYQGNTFLGIGRRWIYNPLNPHWNWSDDNLWFFSYIAPSC
jgi:hypothetical protein